MPLSNVKLPDDERYGIFHSLDIESKIPDFIDVEIETRKGPPKFDDLPAGTVSQIARYRVKSNGHKLAKAHWYLTPNGTILGGPDPLYMCFDDIVISRDR